MLLLISDANILMDVEVGDLTAPMFSLSYQSWGAAEQMLAALETTLPPKD